MINQIVKYSYLSIVWCFLAFGCKQKTTKTQQLLPMPVYEVNSKKVNLTEEFVGQTYGLYDISIRARVEGYVEGVHFQEGRRVKKGQLLYTIEAGPYDAKVAEAEGRVAEAKTKLVQAQSDYERIKPLADENAVSKSDLDAATATLGATKASLEAAEAQLKHTKIESSYTRITSPISGIIGKTNAKVSEFVGREPNPVVLNAVSRIDTILVQFTLSEMKYLEFMKYAKRNKAIYKGEKDKNHDIELILADNSVHPYKGHIDFVDRNVDPTTGTILVQASFPNPDFTIRPGLFAKIRITIDDDKERIVIPQRCLQELQGENSVLVVNKDSVLEYRAVELGAPHSDMQVINSGLKKGEKILLEGFTQVRSGVKIIPQMKSFQSVTEKQN